MKDNLIDCAQCPIGNPMERACIKKGGKAPENCPTLTREAVLEKAWQEYDDPEVLEFARQASIQEGEGYGDRELGYAHVKPVKPRIVEIIEFAGKMNYNRIGLIFCAGLRREAKTVGKLISSKGFDVVSVMCKVGCVEKEKIGVLDEQKIAIGFKETMCNPVAQAMILNHEKTQFNVLMGICVGHDSLVFKYSEAPCTVLAAKDRLLGHNPLAAIYNLDSYYRALK